MMNSTERTLLLLDLEKHLMYRRYRLLGLKHFERLRSEVGLELERLIQASKEPRP